MGFFRPWDLQSSGIVEDNPLTVATAVLNMAVILPLKVAEAGAILPLVELLGRDSSEECHMAALKAIIAVARVSAKMVKEAGGISVLTQLKSSATSLAVRNEAAKALDAVGSRVQRLQVMLDWFGIGPHSACK